MQIIKNKVTDPLPDYPIEKIAPAKDILFMDIETTGFAARTSNVYMIGCLGMEGDEWIATQFFAERYSEEKEVIEAFFDYASSYRCLIHFNGNNFDIPFLEAKCREFDLSYSFKDFTGIDIYRRIAPYRGFMNLENCKQKTVEHFLKIDREDKYSGGDLVGVYHSFAEKPDDESRSLLLLHNFEDLKGMMKVLPVLAITDMFSEKLRVTKVLSNTYKDAHGEEHKELLMHFDLPSPFPVSFSSQFEKCYFAASKNEALVRVPIYECELKYFYANYKDYYYLPDEDVALHKSVASFVDKNHREQAKAANCYTKKEGTYLPEWDALVTPFFKKEYTSKELFFELTEERRTDRELFSAYVSHILEHMVV